MSVTYAKAESEGELVTLTKAQVGKFFDDFIDWNNWRLVDFHAKILLDNQCALVNIREKWRLYQSYLADSPFGPPYIFDLKVTDVTQTMLEEYKAWRLCKYRDQALSRGKVFDCWEDRLHSFMFGRRFNVTHPLLEHGPMLSRGGFVFIPMCKAALCHYCFHVIQSVDEIPHLAETHESSCEYHLLPIKAQKWTECSIVHHVSPFGN